jgi:hypothetical protein
MKSLIEFQKDTDTKNNVHEYLVEFLRGEAIRKVFEREDVSAVSEAKEIIDKAFENLDIIFNPKEEKKERINEAR